MPSFNTINYSLRPNKTIQRQIIFEGLRALQTATKHQDLMYIGLGSLWFADFIMAHKMLKISDMISIEEDEIGYRRALFNRPYATVQVCHGTTSSVLPPLLRDSTLNSRPWIMWLDYDSPFDETIHDDITAVIEQAPPNTVFLATFKAGSGYGRSPRQKVKTLNTLFGDIVPTQLNESWCDKDRLQDTLANLALDLMTSIAHASARPGRFLPAFRATYRDTTPMVTVGGVLPSPKSFDDIRTTVNDPCWRCVMTKHIEAPHLTMLETMTMQAQLPRTTSLTRSDVQEMGSISNSIRLMHLSSIIRSTRCSGKLSHSEPDRYLSRYYQIWNDLVTCLWSICCPAPAASRWALAMPDSMSHLP